MSAITLRVPGIHCDRCKSAIEGAVGGLEGVRSAEVSVAEREVSVDYDEAHVGLDTIKDAITEQGYDVAG